MLNCTQMRESFSDYADGSLSVADTRSFEQHLAHCSRCAADYKLFTATTSALDTIPEIEPPRNLHSAIMRAVMSRPVYATPKWWQVDWLNIFNVKFPVRAVSMGLALTFLFAIVRAFTPIGALTSSLAFSINKKPVQEARYYAPHPNMALKNWGPWGGVSTDIRR